MTEKSRQREASPSASTRPYPNKRDRSDDRKLPTSDDDNQASSSASTSEITQAFSAFRDEIDDHNDRRERLIKVSRDVTGLSKKVIFLLHRFDINDFASKEPSGKTCKLFSDAEAKLEEIIAILRQAAVAEGLGSIDNSEQHRDVTTQMLRAQRYEQNIGGGLEEFVSKRPHAMTLTFRCRAWRQSADHTNSNLTRSRPSPSTITFEPRSSSHYGRFKTAFGPSHSLNRTSIHSRHMPN